MTSNSYETKRNTFTIPHSINLYVTGNKIVKHAISIINVKWNEMWKLKCISSSKKKRKLSLSLFVIPFVPVDFVYFTILNLNLLSENCYEINVDSLFRVCVFSLVYIFIIKMTKKKKKKIKTIWQMLHFIFKEIEGNAFVILCCCCYMHKTHTRVALMNSKVKITHM